MAALLVVGRGNAHEAVHAYLASQHPVGVSALDLDGRLVEPDRVGSRHDVEIDDLPPLCPRRSACKRGRASRSSPGPQGRPARVHRHDGVAGIEAPRRTTTISRARRACPRADRADRRTPRRDPRPPRRAPRAAGVLEASRRLVVLGDDRPEVGSLLETDWARAASFQKSGSAMRASSFASSAALSSMRRNAWASLTRAVSRSSSLFSFQSSHSRKRSVFYRSRRNVAGRLARGARGKLSRRPPPGSRPERHLRGSS